MATITKRGKSYLIRCYAGYSVDGKQITKSMTYRPEPGMTQAKIKKEVQRQAVLFEESVKAGECDGKRIKFEKFAEQWLKDYAEVELAPKTVYDYRKLLLSINAYIGHLYLDDIRPKLLIQMREAIANTPAETMYVVRSSLKGMLKKCELNTYAALQQATGLCEDTISRATKKSKVSKETAQKIADAMGMSLSDVFVKKEGKPRSGNTVRHYMRLVSSVFTKAVEWQYIDSNPAARVGLPKKGSQEQPVLTVEEAQYMLELLDKEPIHYRTAVTVLLMTGMRREELLGLHWRNLDYENQLIAIEKAVQYVGGQGNVEGDTKTRQSRRIVKAAPVVMDCLRTYMEHKQKLMAQQGYEWSKNDYIFGNLQGDIPAACTLTAWFKDFVRRNDLPDIHLHSLRHTAATLLIDGNCPITAVAGTLGHATPATTTTIYAHAIQRATAKSAAVMQDLFGNKSVSG